MGGKRVTIEGDLPPLVTYWDGPLSWLEHLCAASMRAAGHRLVVYSHNPQPLADAGLADEVRDARELVPEDHVANRYREVRQFQHFADVFRLELLTAGLGIWVDLDCLLLRPIARGDGYLFGKVNERTLNNAVLLLPRDSAMLADYRAGINAVPFRMPWSTFQRRWKREFDILRGRPLPPPTARTNIGPRALSYYARKHKVFGKARPQAVYYPILSAEAQMLVDPDDRAARAKITAQSEVVHTWHGNLKFIGALAAPPPAGSYLAQAQRTFGLT